MIRPRSRKKAWQVLYALIAASALMWGQTVLTLDQCLTIAREQSPRIRSAHNAVRAMELSRQELMTTALPQVRLAATSIFAPSSRQFGYDPALSNIGEIAGQVVVQQSLYDGGMRGLRSEQIGLDVQRSNGERRLAERDLTALVKQSFAELLRADQERRLERESVEQLFEYLNLVNQLARGGNAGTTDVLKTQLQLANAQVAHRKSEETFAAAKYSLLEAMGSPLDTAFSITGTLNEESTAVERQGPPDSTSNIELAIALFDIQQSDLAKEMTRHELYPTVSLMGDAGILASGENMRLPAGVRESVFGFSVGVSVELPLFTWGASDLRAQQRELFSQNVRFDALHLQKGLEAEYQKARTQLQGAHERLSAIRVNRSTAEQIYALTRSKFVTGAALSIEVLSAQQALTDVKLSELQTMADIQTLHIRLEQLRTPNETTR